MNQRKCKTAEMRIVCMPAEKLGRINEIWKTFVTGTSFFIIIMEQIRIFGCTSDSSYTTKNLLTGVSECTEVVA